MSLTRIFIYFNIVLVILLVTLFFFKDAIEMYWYSHQKVKQEKYIFIPTGANLLTVTDLLEREKIIDEVDLFIKLAQQKNYQERQVVPGKYKVEAYFTINHLINNLRAGRSALQVKITLNKITYLEDLLRILAEHLEPTSDQFLTYLKNPKTYEKYQLSEENFLTFFISDSYHFWWNTSPEQFVERMFQEHQKFWNTERLKKAENIGLKPEEVVILASIVKAEQEYHIDEQPVIAGLYLNRLRKGMRLQADPTVKYAVNDRTLRRILNRHLQMDHPYNTYKRKGLPPGPINLPEKHSIDAVLNYTRHNYIYMCAMPGDSGKHAFASTYTAHQKNAKEYINWLNEQGIR